MKNLKETEKNFLTCAVVIALVGTALIFLKYRTVGILSIVAAVVFAAIFFKMVIERTQEEKRGGKKTAHEESKNNENSN